MKIVGPAGFGIKSLSELIQKSLAHCGVFSFGYPEYPSLARGGHNTVQITIRSDHLPLNASHLNLILALSDSALELEIPNIDDHTIALTPDKLGFTTYITETGHPQVLNTLFLGYITKKLSLDRDYTASLLLEQYKSKGPLVTDNNQLAFDHGFATAAKDGLSFDLPSEVDRKLICLTGNEAVAKGALSAGIDLYTVYPMTPSTTVLHFLAQSQSTHPVVVHQVEDEIAAINMAIGASFAGSRAMTGTSGGGFALMEEGISLAGMLETPIVIFLSQRPGPATGMPTWTAQADLHFAVFSGHGEFAKIILAPADPLEAYLLTYEAFALAEKYHTPVIVLSDKYLSESFYSLESLPKLKPVQVIPEANLPQSNFFARYRPSDTGISPRTLPGQKFGEYNANSDEHDIHGFSSESESDRLLQNTRRLNKIALLKKSLPNPALTKRASNSLLISWGSHKYIAGAEAENLGFDHLHFSYVWPLPEGLSEILAPYQALYSLENNATAQMAKLITMETGRTFTATFTQDTGRPYINKNLNK